MSNIYEIISDLKKYEGDAIDPKNPRFLELVCAHANQIALNTIVEYLNEIKDSKCESPIEQLMAYGFIAEQKINSITPFVSYQSDPYTAHKRNLRVTDDWLVYEDDDPKTVYVFPQVRVLDRYRADFVAYGLIGGEMRAIAVECDGHDFHERTKEQAQRDKERDREFLAAGVPVMRFTGSEIFKNPHGCAVRVANCFVDIANAQKGEDAILPTVNGEEVPF